MADYFSAGYWPHGYFPAGYWGGAGAPGGPTYRDGAVVFGAGAALVGGLSGAAAALVVFEAQAGLIADLAGAAPEVAPLPVVQGAGHAGRRKRRFLWADPGARGAQFADAALVARAGATLAGQASASGNASVAMTARAVLVARADAVVGRDWTAQNNAFWLMAA